jgi:hypothetical protein
VGGFVGCGILLDATVSCWSDGPVGQALSAEPGHFRQISVGGTGFFDNPPPEFNDLPFACGIKRNLTIRCWGSDKYGQTQPPSGRFRTVAAGGTAACALGMAGRISCWGQGMTTWMRPPLGRFEQVSVGDGFDQVEPRPNPAYACALTTSNKAQCWGGDPGYHRYAKPPSGAFKSISAGNGLTCGIRLHGGVVCWGYPATGCDTPKSCAVGDPPAGAFSQISVGVAACGLRSVTHTAACWANFLFGETQAYTGAAGEISGDPSSTICLVPAPAPHISCWGDLSGDTSALQGGRSGPYTGLSVSAIGGFACALRPEGSLYCWGSSDAASKQCTHGHL